MPTSGESFPGGYSSGELAAAPALDQPPLRRRRRHRPSIRVAPLNITSLMDLTFNLLLFFVLTASFSIKEGILPADVPAPAAHESGHPLTSAVAAPPQTPLLITLRSFGEGDQVAIQLQGSPVTLANFDELYDTLHSMRHDDAENPAGIYQPDNPIMIKPDAGVRWKQVVDAFNAVIRARFTNVGFQPANPE